MILRLQGWRLGNVTGMQQRREEGEREIAERSVREVEMNRTRQVKEQSRKEKEGKKGRISQSREWRAQILVPAKTILRSHLTLSALPQT